jgi:hypothetical protein
VTKSHITLAQQKKECDVNKHRRLVDFKPGDNVWVKTANWSTDWPSKKLSEQMAGPYKVLAKEGHSYRVKLPASIKIHPVFFIGSLCCDLNNLLPSQANAPPPPVNVIADDKYKVQEIIAVKLTREKLTYRAKGTDADKDPEFYSASDFKYSSYLLKRFHLANLTLPGPPVNLPLWLQAWEDRVNDYNHLDSDKPALTCSRTSFFGGGG